MSIQNNELKLVRLIKAIPGNIWAFKPTGKEIQAVCDSVLDMSIPFDLLEIPHGENLEFMFTIANMGVKEYSIPNEMLLTVTRM